MMLRAAAALAAGIAIQATAGTPVAFVADVSGSATIEGDGRRLAFLAELEPGMRVFLGTGARAAITFARSGLEYAAVGPGEFLVKADELSAERGAAPSRREVPAVADMGVVSRVARSATASLRMRSARENGEGAAPGALEYPVATRVATLQPTLRWQLPAGSGHVKVSLVDESGREVWRGEARAQSVKPAVKLSAATRYRWTLMTGGKVAAEAPFETLAADTIARVEKSRASARSFSERVMHAMLLQDLGADQDARAAWADLARERPDVPELARLAR